MQSAGFFRPAGVTANPSPFAIASAPAAQASKLTTLDEEQLELTERDLWEDDAGAQSITLTGLHNYMPHLAASGMLLLYQIYAREQRFPEVLVHTASALRKSKHYWLHLQLVLYFCFSSTILTETLWCTCKQETTCFLT